MSILFSNNASGTLSVQANPADLTLTLQTNEGQLFPNPSGPDFFVLTLEDSSGNVEVCTCTNNTADVLTVTRAQDNTIAQTFAVGSRVELRTTALVFGQFVQISGDVMTGTLDMDGNTLQDAVITTTGQGVVQGLPIRGADNGTGNELVVPSGGADPTIGGSTILTAASSLYVPSTRTLTGGEGIGTIGDLSANRTVALDIDSLTQIQGNALAENDDFLVYDASAAGHRRVSYQQSGLRIITESGTSRTLTNSDMNCYIRCTNAGAVTVNFNTSVGVQGNVVVIEQAGAGTVSIAGTATINSVFASDETAAQYSVLVAVSTAANTWTLYGDGA